MSEYVHSLIDLAYSVLVQRLYSDRRAKKIIKMAFPDMKISELKVYPKESKIVIRVSIDRYIIDLNARRIRKFGEELDEATGRGILFVHEVDLQDLGKVA